MLGEGSVFFMVRTERGIVESKAVLLPGLNELGMVPCGGTLYVPTLCGWYACGMRVCLRRGASQQSRITC